MPQHKSAAKRVRQSAKRRLHNRQFRSRMRTMIKNLQAMDSKENAATYLKEVKAFVDRMATKGIIHRNKAARYVSRLEKHVNALG
ncbi:MAG: 30S ribosomal protein S20 [Bacteroidota bacterium]